MAKVHKRREDSHFAEVGDEFFLTLEDEQVVVCMNHMAFAVLENLDGFTTAKQIGAGLAKASRQKAAEMTAAVERVIQELASLKVIEEVEMGGKGRDRPLNFLTPQVATKDNPAIIKSWHGAELNGGLFVSAFDGDVSVIVPNVTDGPIKTCPAHTCTVPAGLFTPDTVIRTFSDGWRENFKNYRRSGLVQYTRDSTKKGM